MQKETIIAKVTKNLEKRLSFILSGKCVRCRNLIKKENLEAKKASFKIETSDMKHEVNYDENDKNDTEKMDFIIFPLTKHRVAVNNLKVNEVSMQWLIGGFESENEYMKILGYMDFGVVSVMIYFNSETKTPFILLEDWNDTNIPQLMYQSLCSLVFESVKEGEDEFEEEL